MAAAVVVTARAEIAARVDHAAVPRAVVAATGLVVAEIVRHAAAVIAHLVVLAAHHAAAAAAVVRRAAPHRAARVAAVITAEETVRNKKSHASCVASFFGIVALVMAVRRPDE